MQADPDFGDKSLAGTQPSNLCLALEQSRDSAAVKFAAAITQVLVLISGVSASPRRVTMGRARTRSGS